METASAAGLVMGGGIAGLAFAAAMHRLGQKTIVLEAASVLRAYGSGLVLGPTAMLALRRLGLRDEVIAAGRVLDRGGLVDLSMRPLSQDIFGYFSERSGEPFVGIERSVLLSMLADVVPEYRTGARYVAVEDQGDRVSVELESGGRLEAPWAVMADGIRSTGRDAFGVTTVRDAGQWCWRGIAAGVDLAEHGDAFREAWGSEFRYGFTPVGGDRTYWFVTQRDRTPNRGQKLAQGERAAKLLEMADRFPALVARLIRETPPEQILENRLEDIAPLSNWRSRRLVCIGDAAHAMTPNLGQGATQSLEDAVILAKMLANDVDPMQSFAQFQSMRKPRTERAVREARTIGNLAHCPAWVAPVRDAIMRRLPRALSIRQVAWLYEDRELAAALN